MKNFLLLPFLAAVACGAVSAQQVTEFRQPGDVIRLEIKFDGVDARKISTISLYFGTLAPTLATQTGFRTDFATGQSGPTSRNTFRAEVKIPEDIVTGDYKLYVNAQANPGATQYEAGKQFQLPLFHIRNDKSFVPPTITVTELR